MLARRIAIVTTSRADYGIYRPVARALAARTGVEVGYLVSGTHLAADHGSTIGEIEADGLPVLARIDLGIGADDPAALTRVMAAATDGFGKALARTTPDLVLALGDRFEMLAAVAATLPFGLPVAHLHGGELSLGAVDEVIRHAITKISHLHFVATAAYGTRVAQMGEEEWRITVSGAPALDTLAQETLPDRTALEARTGRSLTPAPLLVTLHPETRSDFAVEAQADALLEGLRSRERPIVFTAPNADPGGRRLRARIEAFVAEHRNAVLVESLGSTNYFGMMRIAAAMVGNSSSGIIEAASFTLPVVNIGQRQDGRLRAPNVIDCGWTPGEIDDALERALNPAFAAMLPANVNPYGDGKAGERIAQVLATIPLDGHLLRKRFVDHPAQTMPVRS
ncbi:UDP-N-acetylglucosamine 2-epimerase [Methylorubrum extorquens]|uniref:UDP-N-acetylglucosamine 2-epimerase n=1 Tax=Methylorubrum extorquens (strain CM4 / NCIMB 13688) TaxID=440085 RepID=B7KYN6_METC4|nr:UDP-N-acetylglucosamine 2-epimerase [Methylorubrum extorquens]ACK84787.1 UDP-N-acetylglucosamine 2-epimerase [Methylorubrum extorquens CM4]